VRFLVDFHLKKQSNGKKVFAPLLKQHLLQLEFVFGWLFTIDHNKVRPEIKDSVIRYKMECYHALYRHFTELDEYLEFRNKMAEKVWDQVEAARDDFKLAKSRLENLKTEFSEARSLTFDDYRKVKAQTTLEFPEHEEGGQS